MRKYTLWLVTIIAIIVFFAYPQVYEELLALVFVGAIPFTSYTLSPLLMLVTYALFLAVLVYAFARQIINVSDPARRESASRDRARQAVKKKVSSNNYRQRKTVAKKHFQAAVADKV